MAVVKSLELSVREGSTFQRVIDRIPTYLSDFKEDPRWLLMFVFGRTGIGRRLHRLFARKKVAFAVGPVSMFEASEADIVESLRAGGLFDRLQLPPAVTTAIQQFAESTGCFGNHDRDLDLLPAAHIARGNSDAPVTSGHYFERVNDCAAIKAVQADPLLHGVAERYLGTGARVISTRLWWSFPILGAEAKPEAMREMVHFDLDDWRMLKYFFYLTDVSADSGPHLYIRGSHHRHALRHQLSLTVSQSLRDALSEYGAENLTSIHGQAGFGFAEDPFGFHAGSLARAAPRLMLEVGFGVSPPNRRRFFGERVTKKSSAKVWVGESAPVLQDPSGA